MTNEELSDWVKNQVALGHSPHKLYSYLVQKGYNAEEAGEIIMSASMIEINNNKSQSNLKKYLPYAIILGIIIIVVAAVIFVIESSILEPRLIDKKTVQNTEINKTNHSSQTLEECNTMDCFKRKFLLCEKENITSGLTANIKYYYEIIGLSNNFCKVKSKFLANPNPEWAGKEMICKYDNTKSFDIAVQDMSRCEGELYYLMIKNTTTKDNRFNNTNQTNQTNETNQNITNQEKKDNPEKYFTNGHQTTCYPLTNYDRTTCYIAFGEEKKDIEYCDLETSDELKWYCYRGVGSGTKDLRVCELIPKDNANNKEWCYERVAFNSEKETICEYIQYDIAQEFCFERVATKKKEPQICEMITTESPERIELCKERVASGKY